MSNKRTLDTHYTTKVNEYQESQELLQQLREDIKDINPYTPEYEHIRQQILDLESKFEDELDFYVNTASILFNYYNVVENNAEETPVNNIKDTNKGILKFFLQRNASAEPVSECYMSACNNDTKVVQDRATLLEKYIEYTSSNYVKQVEQPDDSKCMHCGSSNRIIMMNDGIICCNDCQNIEYIIVDHDKPSYKDQPREVTYFSYRRLNHERQHNLHIVRWFKAVIVLLVS
jgi:hypothetical protein